MALSSQLCIDLIYLGGSRSYRRPWTESASKSAPSPATNRVVLRLILWTFRYGDRFRNAERGAAPNGGIAFGFHSFSFLPAVGELLSFAIIAP